MVSEQLISESTGTGATPFARISVPVLSKRLQFHPLLVQVPKRNRMKSLKVIQNAQSLKKISSTADIQGSGAPSKINSLFKQGN